MQHVVKTLESEGWIPDLIILVQCTSPFRLSKHIDEAIDILINNKFTGVASVSETPGHFHPYKIKEVKGDGELVSMIQEEGMKNKIIEITPKSTTDSDIVSTIANKLYKN